MTERTRTTIRHAHLLKALSRTKPVTIGEALTGSDLKMASAILVNWEIKDSIEIKIRNHYANETDRV